MKTRSYFLTLVLASGFFFSCSTDIEDWTQVNKQETEASDFPSQFDYGEIIELPSSTLEKPAQLRASSDYGYVNSELYDLVDI